MAGPWENYQRPAAPTAGTPWQRYQVPNAANALASVHQRLLDERLNAPPPVDTLEGTGRAWLQGGTAALGDEIVAAGVAGRNWLGNALGMPETFGSVDKPIGEVYDASLANQRGRIEQFREERPWLAYPAEIGGAITTAAAVPFVGGAASLGGKVVQGGLNAAGQGAIYGFNAGEGGIESRLRSAGEGALYAAPIGAAAPLAGAMARRLTERLLAGNAAKRVGTTRPVLDLMLTGADDALTGTGAQNIAAGGPNAMLADAGGTFTNMLDTAVAKSGQAGRIARNAVDDRVSVASGQVDDALNTALGTPQGLRETARGIAQGTATARGDAYDAAYAAAIDYSSDAGRRVEEVISRVPRDLLRRAVAEANDEMTSFGIRNQQIMADIADDGTVTFREMLNVEQLDQIKRALQRLARENVDKYGRATGVSLRAERLARDLRSALGGAVDEYNTATALGGDKIAMDRALELGSEALRPGITREMVREGTEFMSDAERAMAATGIRSYIDDTLANVRATFANPNTDAAEAIKALRDLSSRASREKVELVIGKEAADAMFAQLDEAWKAFELRAAVARGSQTFTRTATNEAITRQTDDGIVNAFRSGQVLGKDSVIPRVLQAAMGRTATDKARISDETMSELVRLLTGPRGKDALATLLRLQNADQMIQPVSQRYGRITEQLLRPLAAPLTQP